MHTVASVPFIIGIIWSIKITSYGGISPVKICLYASQAILPLSAMCVVTLHAAMETVATFWFIKLSSTSKTRMDEMSKSQSASCFRESLGGTFRFCSGIFNPAAEMAALGLSSLPAPPSPIAFVEFAVASPSTPMSFEETFRNCPGEAASKLCLALPPRLPSPPSSGVSGRTAIP